MSARIELNWYKILGLPDPTPINSIDPVITGEDKPRLGSPAIVWLGANKALLGLAGVIIFLVIYLLTLK